MSVKTEAEYKCDDCGHIFRASEILKAKNPFDEEQEIVGCPNCKSIGAFSLLCDQAECDEVSTCGWPIADGGYRRTCSEHTETH